MKCTNRLRLTLVVFASFAFVTAQAADQYADSYTLTAGTETDQTGSPVGAPGGHAALSLGHNGSVILTFSDNWIFNKAGNDFKVTTAGTVAESYTVEASNDGGGSWVMIGNGSATKSFDLNGLIDRVNALRITDQGDTDEGYPDGGVDVDAVTAFYPWDLEIDQVSSGYLPENGNKAQITARIVPAVPLTIRFYFNLADVSDERGDAMNHGTQAGDDKDFKFEAQSGFTVQSISQIDTTPAVDHATVQLSCFDYGAYGKIRAQILSPAGVIAGHVTGSPALFTINVPRDDDGNHIADGWSGNSGGALDDNDATPTGNGTAGDRLSRYEEYRGFFVNGSHMRTNPDVKDVFIHDRDGINQRGDFTDSNLGGANAHWIDAGEFLSETSRSINPQWSSHHIDTQRCILLTANPAVISRVHFWGDAIVQPPYSTTSHLCAVYTDSQDGGIASGTALFGGITDSDTTIILSRNSPDPMWELSGKFKIDNEVIAYTSVSNVPPSRYTFTGITRGADGTLATGHDSGATAAYFSDLTSAIRRFVAHESGHNLNINHEASVFISLMSPLPAGANMANSPLHTFRQSGPPTGSLQEFLVK